MANYDLNSITHGNNTYNLRDTTKIPLSGTNALSGSIIPDTDNSYNFGDSSKNLQKVYTAAVYHGLNTGSLVLSGGNGASNGAYLALYGASRTDGFQGRFDLVAKGSSNYSLTGKTDGTLTWGSKNVAMQEDVIPKSGGAVITGDTLGRIDNTSRITLCGGVNNTEGGSITIYGKNQSTGDITMQCYDGGTLNSILKLHSNGTWSWNGQPIQYTSDQRLKQQIAEIDDKLLDAWEDVNLVQFKYNDAVDQKSDNARLHTGYVVQQIDEACKKHNVDISEYGLYCHEEYPEETEEVEVEQADGTKTKERKVIREASEHYSLRYTEALIVECAYLRKCIKELKEEIKELKNKD